MCSSVLCAFSPNIYVPHFPVYSKAVQHFLTLWSTPRGPPARKSSHCPTRFAFPSWTVQILFIVREICQLLLRLSSGSFFVCTFKLLKTLRTVRSIEQQYVRFRPPCIFLNYVRSSLCPIYSTPFDVSYVPYVETAQLLIQIEFWGFE